MPRARGDGRPTSASQAALDDVLAAAAARAEEIVDGKTVFTGASMLGALVGVPCPSLAFSWLIGCNVVPFGRVAQIVGPESTGKSAFMAELMRSVVALYGNVRPRGSVHYINNEPKPSWPLVGAVLWEHLGSGVVTKSDATSMDEWQRHFTAKIVEWESLWAPEGKTKAGWVAPLFIGVDSLMGTACDETTNALRKEGSATRRFPVEARLLADFARSLCAFVGRRPILFVTTNHLKHFTDPMGMPHRAVPGGKAFQFMESFEFELSRVRDINTAARKGFVVKVRAHKNCVGESRRSIEVPFVWEFGDAGDERPQRAIWDWPGATITLFKSMKLKDKTRWDRVQEIVDVHEGRNSNLAWSNALGVPSGGAVSNHELGCMIEERPDMLDALAPVLDLNRGRFFRAGMDYVKLSTDVDGPPDSHAVRAYRRPRLGEGASGDIGDGGPLSAGGFLT